ncbi:MAG: histidine--tRNA ligase [Spirochaetes bacterium]|nr:histidine--tRNA ligase [Spirochaetota bacterium]
MISKPPGIEDIFPDSIEQWNYIIRTAREVFRLFNIREIIIPILEFTEVFARSIGDETDIVSKEMFTFEDRGGRSLTLRPEGTASVVRAYVENGDYNRLSSCKLFYIGPMFRAERPQKGRLRQFNQFGAELFGSAHPFSDFEAIACMDLIAKRVGIHNYTLLINSIGCTECRPKFIEKLTQYYRAHTAQLCSDCLRRLEKNPLRILDCKTETCVQLKGSAPPISEFLCQSCMVHHRELKNILVENSIAFTESPHLVRGLDYYTRTTFEFVTGEGSQNAFAAGGRYDNLVELFGGKPTPAVGFAAGIERILLLLNNQLHLNPTLDVYIVHSGDVAFIEARKLTMKLRECGISVDMEAESKGFRSQFKKADRENAQIVIIIGEEEIENAKYSVKNMISGLQETISRESIIEHVKQTIRTKK